MEEKIFAQGNLDNIKKIRNAILGVGFIVVAIMGVVTLGLYIDYINFERNFGRYVSYGVVLSKKEGAIISGVITGCLLVICLIVAGIVYRSLSKISITVTNKRVYGKALFEKQVDLPLDSISALGMGMFSSIVVATSSGKIKFWGIGNRDEVYKIISELLQKRQIEQRTEFAKVSQVVESPTEEIKKYKELLDSGIISQEEFETKKKQLLNL